MWNSPPRPAVPATEPSLLSSKTRARVGLVLQASPQDVRQRLTDGLPVAPARRGDPLQQALVGLSRTGLAVEDILVWHGTDLPHGAVVLLSAAGLSPTDLDGQDYPDRDTLMMLAAMRGVACRSYSPATS